MPGGVKREGGGGRETRRRGLPSTCGWANLGGYRPRWVGVVGERGERVGVVLSRGYFSCATRVAAHLGRSIRRSSCKVVDRCLSPLF